MGRHVRAAGTPKDIVDKLNGAVRARRWPGPRSRRRSRASRRTCAEPPRSSATFVKAQLASWGKSIKDAGIQPE